jgi:hypothetical protein
MVCCECYKQQDQKNDSCEKIMKWYTLQAFNTHLSLKLPSPWGLN